MKKITFTTILTLLVFSVCNYAEESIAIKNIQLNLEEKKLKTEFHIFLQKEYNPNDRFFLNNITKALQNNVIADGHNLNVIKTIFHDKVMIENIQDECNVVRKTGFISIDKSYEENLKDKLPGVPGPSWFIYFNISEKNEVYNISLRYFSVKSLYLKKYK